MLLIVVSLVMLIAGIIMTKVMWNEIWGYMVGVIGGIILVFILFVCITIIPLTTKDFIEAKYPAALIEREQLVEYDTGLVRGLATEVNQTILSHRVWSNNLWVGIFFPKEIAELELIR